MFSSRLEWRTGTNRFSEAVEARRRSGGKVYDLSESNPTHAGFAWAGALEGLVDSGALVYEPHPRGLRAAREAVAGYYAERQERVDPERIWMTCSTSEAYSILFKLLADPGDHVLVPGPSYPLLDFLGALEGLRLSPYRLHQDASSRWRIDFDSLRAHAAPRTRAVVVVSPNNPTGSYLHASDLDALLQLCADRQMALIVDEVFFDYRLDPGVVPGRVLAQEQVLAFVLSGVSKVLALPQMKVGWIAAMGPGDTLADASTYLDLIADTYLSAGAPALHALSRWLPARRTIQARILERLRANLAAVRTEARDGSWEALPVEGGWYGVMRLGGSAARNEEELVVRLVEDDGVIIHPGFFFDFETEGFLVASLLAPPGDFLEGLSLIRRRLRSA